MDFTFTVQRVITFGQNKTATPPPDAKAKGKGKAPAKTPAAPGAKTRLILRSDAGVANLITDDPAASSFKEGQTVTVSVK